MNIPTPDRPCTSCDGEVFQLATEGWYLGASPVALKFIVPQRQMVAHWRCSQCGTSTVVAAMDPNSRNPEGT